MSDGKSSIRETSRGSVSTPVPDIVYHICRILLALIFIIACYEKTLRPWDFGRAIYVYKLLVGPLAYLISPMAIIMPPLELVTGILLLINRMVRPAALIILAMNIMFLIAIGSVMLRGISIECGCGLDIGIIAMLVGTQADSGAIVRDLVILAMNLVVLFAPQSARR